MTTQVADSIGYAERDGWKLAEHTGTPRWAEFAAVNGPRRFWQRIVLLCDGQSYGTVQLQYSAVDAGDIVPVIDRLKRSFQAASC